MENQENTPNILELVRKMEGVENNAFVMRLLASIYAQISKEHPDAEENLTITFGVLGGIMETANAKLEANKKLPKEDQDYLAQSELAAQASFVEYVMTAFSDPELRHNADARSAWIQQKAAEHAEEAENAVREPLAQLRKLAGMPEDE